MWNCAGIVSIVLQGPQALGVIAINVAMELSPTLRGLFVWFAQ